MTPETIVREMTPQRLCEAATASTATLAHWYGADADFKALNAAVRERLSREGGASLDTLRAEGWVRG